MFTRARRRRQIRPDGEIEITERHTAMKTPAVLAATSIISAAARADSAYCEIFRPKDNRKATANPAWAGAPISIPAEPATAVVIWRRPAP